MRPTFLGVGVMKCGTTTLHHYLKRHPDVFVPEEKESNFLLHHYTPPLLEKYEAMFEGGIARGEICPGYNVIPERIAALYPDVKIIIMVRDPVERMISHMRHNIKGATSDHTFIRVCSWAELRQAVGEFEGDAVRTHDTIRQSSYQTIIPEFQDRFRDVLVMETSTLSTAYEEAYIRVCQFLEVHPFLPNGPLVMHTGDEMGRERLPMTDEEREYFRTEVFGDTYRYMRDEFGINFGPSSI